MYKIFFLFFIFFFLYGCTTKNPLPKLHSKSPKIQINSHGNLDQYFHLQNTNTKKDSYFYPLDEASDALAARLFLIDHAKKTIDVQYYIYKEDESGAIFTYHLLKAADRGVKIRLLIDDLDTSGKDKSWLMGTQHPNISLKLFNPIKLRKSFRFVQLALNIDSLGRRMHNKSLIIDNKYAIIGGRNIGNEYYATGDKTLFLDFDVLTVGAITKEIQTMFDLYWNSNIAKDGNEVLNADFSNLELQKALDILNEKMQQFLNSSIALGLYNSVFIQQIKTHDLYLTKAKAEFYYDLPQKITTDEDDDTYHITKKIGEAFKKIKHSLLIISPYFIPTHDMIQKFQYLRDHHVEIIIITNSLASTDVFLVYSGYQKHIRKLLKMGIKIYEIKPNSFARLKSSKSWIRQNRISLHSKLMVLDNRYLTLGSANIDPRSIKLNTETFMIIDSKKLCNTLIAKARDVILSDDLIELSWGEIPRPYTLKGIKNYGVIYKTTENGKKIIYYKPPYSGFWKILGTNIMSYLPIDGYL